MDNQIISDDLIRQATEKATNNPFYQNLLEVLNDINKSYVDKNYLAYFMLIRRLKDEMLGIFTSEINKIERLQDIKEKSSLWKQVANLDKQVYSFESIDSFLSLREIQDTIDISNNSAHQELGKPPLNYKDYLPSKISIRFLVQYLIYGNEQKQENERLERENPKTISGKQVFNYEELFTPPVYEDLEPLKPVEPPREIHWYDKKLHVQQAYLNLIFYNKNDFKNSGNDIHTAVNITRLICNRNWQNLTKLIKQCTNKARPDKNPRKIYQLQAMLVWVYKQNNQKNEAVKLAVEIYEKIQDNIDYLDLINELGAFIKNNCRDSTKDITSNYFKITDNLKNYEVPKELRLRIDDLLDTAFKSSAYTNTITLGGNPITSWLNCLMNHIAMGQVFNFRGFTIQFLHAYCLQKSVEKSYDEIVIKLLVFLFSTNNHNHSDLQYFSAYLERYDLQNHLLDIKPIIKILLNKQDRYSSDELKFIKRLFTLFTKEQQFHLLGKVTKVLANYTGEFSSYILVDYFNLYQYIILDYKDIYEREKDNYFDLVMYSLGKIKTEDYLIPNLFYAIFDIWHKYGSGTDEQLSIISTNAKNLIKDKSVYGNFISNIYAVSNKVCPSDLASEIDIYFTNVYLWPINSRCMPNQASNNIIDKIYDNLQKSIAVIDGKTTNSDNINPWEFIHFINITDKNKYKQIESRDIFFDYVNYLEHNSKDNNNSFNPVMAFIMVLISLYANKSSNEILEKYFGITFLEFSLRSRQVLQDDSRFEKFIEKYITSYFWEEKIIDHKRIRPFSDIKRKDELDCFIFLSSILNLVLRSNNIKSIDYDDEFKIIHTICAIDLHPQYAGYIYLLGILSNSSSLFKEIIEQECLNKMKLDKIEIAKGYATLYKNLFSDKLLDLEEFKYLPYPVYTVFKN